MIKKSPDTPSLFSSLSDMLNQSHPLYTEVSTATAEEYQTEYDEAMAERTEMPMPEEEEK